MKNIALWIAQGLLAATYAMAGFMKVFQLASARESFAWAAGSSDIFIRFIGTVELLGAIGLVLPLATKILPRLTPFAALGLALIQALAIFTVHLPRQEYGVIPFNLVLLGLAIFIAIGRWKQTSA